MTSRLFSFTQRVRSALRPLGIERATFLKPVYRLFKQSLKRSRADVEGFTLELDPEDSLDLSISSDYELFERNLIKKWIKPGWTVLDIGAHIGLFTLLMARLVGDTGRVYSFEPCPDSYRLLQKNIDANGCVHVVATQAAVGSVEGKVRLFLNPKNSGDHRIYPSKKGAAFTEVDSIPLDLFPSLQDQKIDFIKMDIQGAEWDALMGMRNLTGKNSSLGFLLEFWPSGLRNAGADPNAILSFFFERGFRLFHLDEEHERMTEIHPHQSEDWFRQLEQSFGAELQRHTNLVAVGPEGSIPD